MVKNEDKLKVIFWIDKWSPALKGSIYWGELQTMRKRYIYKDISSGEWIKDIEYLKSMRRLIWHFYENNEFIDKQNVR